MSTFKYLHISLALPNFSKYSPQSDPETKKKSSLNLKVVKPFVKVGFTSLRFKLLCFVVSGWFFCNTIRGCHTILDTLKCDEYIFCSKRSWYNFWLWSFPNAGVLAMSTYNVQLREDIQWNTSSASTADSTYNPSSKSPWKAFQNFSHFKYLMHLKLRFKVCPFCSKSSPLSA